MGQKVCPIGLRIGITEKWRSRWYADKANFGNLLVEDYNIRKFIKKNYNFAGIPRIEIERNREEVKVILHTARPGIIIGRKGTEVDKLRADLESLIGRAVKVDIVEVDKAETNAQLIAESIVEQLERRASFRRTVKKAVDLAMSGGAKGIKVELAGRLGGADMSRREKTVVGSIPLQTLRGRIDYGFAEARTISGRIGCKVWIYKGEGEDEEQKQITLEPPRPAAPPVPAPAQETQAQPEPQPQEQPQEQTQEQQKKQEVTGNAVDAQESQVPQGPTGQAERQSGTGNGG